jgi:hypothetical protein
VVVLEQLHHANRSRNQCKAAPTIREDESAPEGSATRRHAEIAERNRPGGINSLGNNDNAATLDFITMRFMDKRTASVLSTILLYAAAGAFLGCIEYNGKLSVHSSLLNVVLHD